MVRGAVWTVPAVSLAAAAPAFAASTCSERYNYRLDWGTTLYTPPVNLTNDPNVGTATVPASAGGTPGASSVTVTFTSTLQGTTTRYDSNLTVLGTTGIGGLGANERGVAVRSATTGAAQTGGTTIANSQTITVRFSRPVASVNFTVVDLDADTSFWDRVSFSPLPTTFIRAAAVDGNGNTGGELLQPLNGGFRYAPLIPGPIADTSGAGNVEINYSGGAAFTSFQLIYWNARATGPQGIVLSDFTFTALGC